MNQKDEADEVEEEEVAEEKVRNRKVKGGEIGKKGAQESQQMIGIEDMARKIVGKTLDRVIGVMEKFMAKVEKGMVIKDKKVSEERYGTIILQFWLNIIIFSENDSDSEIPTLFEWRNGATVPLNKNVSQALSSDQEKGRQL